MVLDARLRECDYGELTQCPRDLMEEESLRRITEPFPRGESMSMVVQRVGTFLQDVYDAYNGKTIVVIGHRATRYGLEYWSGDASLAEIVHTPWDWLAVPIWRYEIHAHHLMRRSRELE
jgi:broad specificity phosphatase PhoE